MTTLTEQDLDILDELAKADSDGYHEDPAVLVDGLELAHALGRGPETLRRQLLLLEQGLYVKLTLFLNAQAAPLEDTTVRLTRLGRRVLVKSRYEEACDQVVEELRGQLVAKGEGGVVGVEAAGRESAAPSWVVMEGAEELVRESEAEFWGNRNEYLKPTPELLWGDAK